MVDPSWWRKLGDGTLNGLVDQAANQNRDLATAEARIREARAMWREARLAFFPSGSMNASYTNTRNAVTSQGGAFNREIELYSTGFDAQWELDLFGRVRNSVKAARATSNALIADRDALFVTLSSEVASNYMELRGAQAQLRVARENADNQAESLRIAEASLKGGRGTRLDVARASAQWNATVAQVPVYEEAIARSIHRIAVLCGRNPSELRGQLGAYRTQPQVPSKVSIVKPAEMIRRRPDVRSAEDALEAETARVGVAVADLFPRVTFNGSFGFDASTLANFTAGGADAFSFGPRLTWAGLNLTRVRQQIAAAGHRADAALNRYEQTVLLALEESENALTSFDRERARLRYLEASASAAQEAVTLARQRYKDGVADFLAVLDAERVALNAQNDVTLSRTKALNAWISIYKAMGGGWTLGEPPKKKTAAAAASN